MKLTSEAEEGPYLCPHLPAAQGCRFPGQHPRFGDALAVTLFIITPRSRVAHSNARMQLTQCLTIYSTMTLLLNSFPSWILLLQQNLPLTCKGQKETSGAAHEQSNVPGASQGSSIDSSPISWAQFYTWYKRPLHNTQSKAPCYLLIKWWGPIIKMILKHGCKMKIRFICITEISYMKSWFSPVFNSDFPAGLDKTPRSKDLS